MANNENKEVLLKVEHLKQYFKFGKHELPAVDDVNFDIYRGEVFGLVGESGCGKTTTGRTIIRLYDATGGSVYFDGKRIVAGVLESRPSRAGDIQGVVGVLAFLGVVGGHSDIVGAG